VVVNNKPEPVTPMSLLVDPISRDTLPGYDQEPGLAFFGTGRMQSKAADFSKLPVHSPCHLSTTSRL